MFKYRTKTYTPIAHLFEQEILRTEDLLISEVSQSLAFIILLHLIIPTLHLLFIVLRTGTGDMVTDPMQHLLATKNLAVKMIPDMRRSCELH